MMSLTTAVGPTLGCNLHFMYSQLQETITVYTCVIKYKYSEK